MDYYYTDSNNQPKGPVSLEALSSLAASGVINSTTMVAPVGSQQWLPLGTIIPAVATITSAPAAALATGAPNEPLAVWSLVLSIVGFCCFPLVGVVGIIFGHISLSHFKTRPELQGKGLATAGLIVGYLGILFWILYFVVFGGLAVFQSLLEQAK